MTEELSNIDLKILEYIQKDSSLSTAELAERVGLSQSPCWRRLQRLRDEGYIKGEVALLDRDKFNSSLFIFATLKIGSLTEEDREKFKRKVELTPEILECYAIFGERDVMIKVIAPTIDWYQRFVFSTVLKLPGVVDIQSIVTLNEMKYSTALPVRALQNVQ
jgi:Lrp/AsnC family transcriptional regulator